MNKFVNWEDGSVHLMSPLGQTLCIISNWTTDPAKASNQVTLISDPILSQEEWKTVLLDTTRHAEILRMLDDLDLRIIRPDTNIMAAKLRDEEPDPKDVALLKELIEVKDILRDELHEIQERTPELAPPVPEEEV